MDPTRLAVLWRTAKWHTTPKAVRLTATAQRRNQNGPVPVVGRYLGSTRIFLKRVHKTKRTKEGSATVVVATPLQTIQEQYQIEESNMTVPLLRICN